MILSVDRNSGIFSPTTADQINKKSNYLNEKTMSLRTPAIAHKEEISKISFSGLDSVTLTFEVISTDPQTGEQITTTYSSVWDFSDNNIDHSFSIGKVRNLDIKITPRHISGETTFFSDSFTKIGTLNERPDHDVILSDFTGGIVVLIRKGSYDVEIKCNNPALKDFTINNFFIAQ